MEERYTKVRPLGDGTGPRVSAATDSFTGETVVLKTGELRFVVREAHCLLSLPRGVAPGVRDLVWQGRGNLLLVREHLEGHTLAECASEIPLREVPQLAQRLCQCLAHVHRTGYVYADLKPENVFVLERAGTRALRLLDFGFALNRFAPDEARGGTPPYLAPE